MKILEAYNYSDSLLSQLYILQQDNIQCDARLTAEREGISAHKVVLMAASSYLNASFSTKIQSEIGNKGSVHIQNTPFRLVERVVKFIYTGKLEISETDLDMTLNLCKHLDITPAIELCEKFRTDLDQCTNQPNDNTLNATLHNVSSNVDIECEGTAGNVDPVENITEQMDDNGNNEELMPLKKRKKDMLENDGKETGQRLRGKSARKTLGNHKNNSKSTTKTVRKGRNKKQLIKVKTIKLKEKTKSFESANGENEISVDEGEETGSDACGVEIVNAEMYTSDNVQTEKTESANNVNNQTETDVSASTTMLSKKGKFTDKRKQGARKKNAVSKKESKVRVKVRRFKRFPCSLCDKILTSHKRLAFHEYSKHGAPYDETRFNMYPCPHEGCAYVSGSKSNLQTHLKSRHGEDRPHVCEFCGKAFKLPNVLAIHLNIHTGSKMWKCGTCGEEFNQQSGLSIHIKRHHMGESTWGELCHLCSEKFLQKSDLAWHLFRAHDQPLPEKYKVYICDICNYLTKSSQDLQRHQNAHNGIRQFSCSYCKKSCSTKSQLKRHEKFHGEKSFKCTFDNCSYACVDSIGLSKHIKLMHTHKNFKPFICPVCSYKTGVKGNLDKHIRQVHFLEVVTKHTVQLKMKYAKFESGDIITKDGQLIASAKERKEMHKRCLEENRMAMNFPDETEASVKSIIQDNENRMTFHVDDGQSSIKPMADLKPVSFNLKNVPAPNSVINLSSLNSSHSIYADSVVGTSPVPANNVVYVQNQY